jgi:ring-1,2-phenylacetyl-CoA epoxidase subunit PaaE
MIFYKDLIVLKDQFPNTLQTYLFCTREINDDTLNSRIDESVILDIISDTNTDNILHYICGPKELKDDIKNYLLKNGFHDQQILTEDFESNIDPEQLKNISTQFVKINEGINSHEIEVIRGKSILEAVLDYGLEVPYSCQTGNCKLCKGKLLSGEVKIINNQYNSDELDSDEFLLCCSYPLTENIIFKLN